MRSPLKKRIMCDRAHSPVWENIKESEETTSLQEAFLKFRKGRQKEMKNAKIMEEKAIKICSDSVKMVELRKRFLEGCKRYFGVPYAKRYHEPGTPMYESPLFLDCCGLIRQVLRDLKAEFGFKIGPWNQSYMFDTLPINIENIEEMKAGDLVFISGTYFNPKSKKQRHDMVHVEVWLGEGEKTIGARWQKGKVQVFDSYKFVSKSYHSMNYYFKSIDTWLMGVCKSYCPEHPWRASPYMPGKKSIFSLDDFDDIDDESAGDDDSEGSGDEIKASEEADHKTAFSGRDQELILKSKPAEGASKNSCSRLVKETACVISKNERILSPERGKSTCQQAQSVDVNAKSLSLTDGRDFSQNKSVKLDQPSEGHNISLTSSALSNKERDISENLTELRNNHVEEVQNSSKLVRNRTNVQHSYKDCLIETICHCPECKSSEEWNCIHTLLSEDEHSQQQDCFSNLLSCAELSTSLECFELVSNEEHREVEDMFHCCPLNSESRNRCRKSSSPSKDVKKGDNGSSNSSSGGGNDESSDGGNGNSPLGSPRLKSRPITLSRQPGFYIGGGNGNWMIENVLIAQGWRKIEDRNDESFKLKWVECKSHINYSVFREGEQLVNHISNINLLTTKMGLLSSLQEYERVLDKTNSRHRFHLSDFFPETHCLMNLSAKKKFMEEIYKDGETWICKPTGLNQGKGIYLIGNLKQLRKRLLPSTDESPARRFRTRPAQERIIQRYIMNPLLLDKRKFDIRAYMLIASTLPYVVLYHPGYVRLACVPYTPYSPDTEELHAHLTNQYVQKKSPLYKSMKEDTVWDFDQLQTYIDKYYTEAKDLPSNWVFTSFTKRMQQIMLTCFQSVKQKLHRRMGTFDLLGFDFMIDDDFKVWLIEINVNPALHTNCQVLKDMLPSMVDETLKTVIEIFEKSKKKAPIFPLQSMEGFRVLYNGEGKG